MKIYVERQIDGWYAALDEHGLIVQAETQTAAAGLAKAKRPKAAIYVGRHGKWRRWQDKHVGRGRAN